MLVVKEPVIENEEPEEPTEVIQFSRSIKPTQDIKPIEIGKIAKPAIEIKEPVIENEELVKNVSPDELIETKEPIETEEPIETKEPTETEEPAENYMTIENEPVEGKEVDKGSWTSLPLWLESRPS